MAFFSGQVIRVAVDLRELRYKDWPGDARALARAILARPGKFDQLREQLDRRDWRDWLASQVEAEQAIQDALGHWLVE